MEMSKDIENYFKSLDKEVMVSYNFANQAKKKGYDPDDFVDVPLAKNMAERVVGLISIVAPQLRGVGIENRIQELEEKYGKLDWRVALSISLEVAQQKFCKFKDVREAMEVGIRIGLAYLTVGVVVSPIEGFVKLEFKKRRDGKDYLCLYFSGPIRSAGGTATAVTLVVADYIRKSLGYDVYDPTENEIKRAYVDVRDYHERVTNLQYFPTEDEVSYLIKHYGLQIDGDPSDKFEVSNYKDLGRVGTNYLRSGFSLVVAECFAQKSKKVYAQLVKWGNEFGLEHWNYLKNFLELQQKIKARQKVELTDQKLAPDYTYIKDLVAGRPVFTHPLRYGGFRLRYGRCRTSGLSAQAVHPATMFIVDSFIAIGTQLKVERPGKSCIVTSCDTIDGPIVKLKNGDVVRVESVEIAKKVIKDVSEIIYLGDLLINYGDFLDRAHKLVPCGYNEEWWMLESGFKIRDVNIDDAIRLVKEKGYPLHPRYTFFWTAITKKQFVSLIDWLKLGHFKNGDLVLVLDYDPEVDVSGNDPKLILELLGVPHLVVKNKEIIIVEEWIKALIFSLGGCVSDVSVTGENVLEIVNRLSGCVIRDKAGTFIGARMGRPEKAKMRKMIGSPHVLFPVGEEGGRLRSFQCAIEKGKVTAQFPLKYCKKCDLDTIYPVCEKCSSKTIQKYKCWQCGVVDKEVCHDICLPYGTKEIDIKHYFDFALNTLKIKHYPEVIKGVRGTNNATHTPENLVKGFLRAIYGLNVNKDGTIRYDMIEMPLTHFKACEIDVSVSKLKKLGYTKDIYNIELKNADQIIEIKPQDVILPSCPETLDNKAGDVLLNITKFIDDLCVKFYGLEKFYNCRSFNDLVGQLVVCMSPHTSAGVIARVIGFSKTQGLFAHPYLHSLMRRDCDGDEACVILLMDILLNFSKKYIPATRGAKQDEPLILTSRLIPSEVDDMVFNMDTCFSYPLELYEGALEYKNPWEVKVDRVGDFLGTEKQYEGFGFTHDTKDINAGNHCSSYKSIPSMQEKVQRQMLLGDMIRAVDEVDVARLVIERHFMRDIKGNLRKFSMQQFRCVSCNSKYRRPPLSGKCLKCKGKLLFTISQGTVVKYLEPTLSLAEKYDLPAYLQQTLELIKRRIESVFGKEKEKQEALGKWFG